MEPISIQRANENKDDDHMRQEFPALPGSTQTLNNAKTQSPSLKSSSESLESAASLMEAIKGLLDLNKDYSKNIETQYRGIVFDFLALTTNGASRVMCGERIYCNISKSAPTHNDLVKDTWVEKARE